VDAGQDPAILDSIARTSTGIGKWPVEQVVLTHDHSDHSALLPLIREKFNPRVLAFSPNVAGPHVLLRDGDAIKMGDEDFRSHLHARPQQRLCVLLRPRARRPVRG